MTMARVQPCLKNLGTDLGFYIGKEKWPRNFDERNNALFLNVNQISLIKMFQGVHFSNAKEELKSNFKKVDYFITDKNFIALFDYEFELKKIQSQLTNFVV